MTVRLLAALVTVGVLLVGCAPHPTATPSEVHDPRLTVHLTVTPAVPRSLDTTTFNVTVRDTQNQPVSDATVALDLAMPEMEMPKNEIKMQPVSPGHLRGHGQFTMAGRWRVTATARHGSAVTVQAFPTSVR